MSSLAVAALILISQVKAEDAPADTTTFVSMCTTDFEVCRRKVVDVSNYNMVEMLEGTMAARFRVQQATLAWMPFRLQMRSSIG